MDLYLDFYGNTAQLGQCGSGSEQQRGLVLGGRASCDLLCLQLLAAYCGQRERESWSWWC